ncbi:MAG: recombinase RecT [Thermoanaerobacteraceae bacterium]|nr:recombinase RecT [Thermoanaerobacteraceae bacterium]
MAVVNGDNIEIKDKISQKPKTKVDQAITLVARMKGEMSKALPMHLKRNAERYVRIAMTLIRENPTLASCDGYSLLGALMTGTALGLDPSPQLGQFYIVPFGRKAVFILGYKGLIDLAFRSNRVATIFATEVYETDIFDYSYGLEQKLIHKPSGLADPGRITHYYAVVKFTNGGYVFHVMTNEQVHAYGKKYSPSYSSSDSPWQTNPIAMGKKTVIRQLAKYMPLSPEMAYAIVRDESVVSEGIEEIKDEKDIIDITPEYPTSDSVTT